jgi:hypothetical protein
MKAKDQKMSEMAKDLEYWKILTKNYLKKVEKIKAGVMDSEEKF